MRDYIDDLEHQLSLANEAAQNQEAQYIQQLQRELQDQEAQHAQQLQEAQQAQGAHHASGERVRHLERELEDTRSASQIELAALRARLATSAVSQHEVAMLQEQLLAKAREAIILQARANEAQMAAEMVREQRQNVGDRHEIEDLQAQVRRRTDEIESLRTRLAETEASAQLEFASIQKQVQLEADDRQAMSDLQARLTEHSSLIQALEVQLAEKSRALVDLGSNVGNVDASLQALDQQLQRKTEEAAALEASLSETRAQAQERINALQAQLEASQANDGQTDEQAEAQAAIIAQLESELANKSTSLDRLEGQLAEANESLGTLESQLAATADAVEIAIDDAQRVDAHDEVITSIAQELRTPMSSVMGYTDLLLGESVGIIGALQRKFLQRVKANTERMASLLDNLVSISALDSGQLQLEPAKVDVTSVLEEAIAATSAQFQEKNLTLRLQIEDDLPTITADQDALYQIVSHMLTNASLATPVDGEALLSASQVEGAVPGPQGGDHETTCVLISVTDAGGGISSVDQARVFMRKYRADNPLIDGLGDTGVALSIAKTLVDAHGGRIWLDSEPDIGSTFNVLLPVDRLISDVGVEQAE
jgi:signal transduction histidine kinase